MSRRVNVLQMRMGGAREPRRSRASFRSAVVFIGACSLGCAHVSDDEQRAREADRREVDLLRERVARLERQQSDNNAKLDRVLSKLEAMGDDDGKRSAREAPRPVRTAIRVPEREPSEAPSAFHVNETVEISRGQVDDEGSSGAAMSESHGVTALTLDGGDAASDEDGAPDDGGEPIVIDARAISRLDARDQATMERGRASKRPNNEARTPPGHVDPGRAKDPPGRARPTSVSAADADLVTSSNPKLVYKRAMQHFDEGRCDLAERGFSAILTRAPDHDLADNALYWTGVCRQRAGRLEEARQLFADVSLRYPSSNKLADALYSLGEVNEAVGDTATARMYYGELISRFPDAERSSDARKNLARLEKKKGGKP